MFDLTVLADGAVWKLVDEEEGELGSFGSEAEALKAAGDFAIADAEPRFVLIQDQSGEWAEQVVEPPACH